MKVEGKEISVFAFLFATGTAAGMFIVENKTFSKHISFIFTLSFYLALSSAAFSAVSLSFIRKDSAFPWRKTATVLLSTAFFFCGISGFSPCLVSPGFSSSLHCTHCPNEGTEVLTVALEASARSLKAQIDSIPYKEKSSNALVKALITGDKSGLGKDLTDNFRKSGASHILALSGMHLGIIYIILSNLLSLMGNSPASKKLRAGISVCASGFYVLITGSGPSIVRAFLFICINETASCLNRKSNPLNTFCTALLIQLALSPENIKSAGFQLSYLAMAGIYFLYPFMKTWYGNLTMIAGKKQTVLLSKKFDPMQNLWNAAALSISCQIFTAPAAWIHFKSFPTSFLITNIIAMPLTTIAIQYAILVTALHAAGFCPDFLTVISEQAIQLLVFCIRIIGGD